MKKFFLVVITITLVFATLIYFVFTYGTEWLSGVVADVIPYEVEKSLGASTLQSMEVQSFEPSSLPIFTQNKIKNQFYKIFQKDSNDVHLLFRNASYPNAFALPGNYIVILDSLVKMSEDTLHYADVMGVLAHEAGHLHYKHSLKLMIKAGLTGAIIGYFIGDFSSFIATVTHQLLSLSYSRKYEEQADDFAINILHQSQISTKPLAHLLQKISHLNNESEMPEFLSTHPLTDERIKKLEER